MMSAVLHTLMKIRQGGDVKRFHTVTMHREHLVSSHSWGVATLILHVIPEPSLNLIKAALWHDVAEQATGDMPATTKWANPALAAALADVEESVEEELGLFVVLNEYERWLLKFFDMADLVLACLQEYHLGNREALVIAKRGVEYLMNKGSPCSECTDFIVELKLYLEDSV